MKANLFNPATVGTNYEPELGKYEALGAKAGAKPASADSLRTMLLIVDPQRDFVHPDGALSVPGAVGDMQRLIDWIYRNLESITTIGASLDTHQKMMIFHPMWWKNMATGENPAPFTQITLANIKADVWRAVGNPTWSVRYVDQLEKAAKKTLMIWPYHCIAGTDGQKLVPALHEAMAYHKGARGSEPQLLTKGTVPEVEHYGIFAAEVPYDKNPKASGLNTDYLDLIGKYDRIYVAGEAKSHCVLETMRQMLKYFGSQPEVVKKIHFMVDCTSSVVSPDVDFEAEANAALAEMEKQGVVMIKSTDPVK